MKKFLVITLLLVAAVMMSACAKRSVSTRMSASAATAQLRSEGMRIWSRPLEIGFVIDTSKGDDGRMVGTYPEPGQVVTERMSEGEVRAVNAQQGLFSNSMTQTIPVFGNEFFNFNALPPVQQAAILHIIKKNDLDGFYVTMIEETIATTVGSKSGRRNFQVVVKGLALKIKEFGEVSPERADAERNSEAASKEVHYLR